MLHRVTDATQDATQTFTNINNSSFTSRILLVRMISSRNYDRPAQQSFRSSTFRAIPHRRFEFKYSKIQMYINVIKLSKSYQF
jgi:hypothetical protein